MSLHRPGPPRTDAPPTDRRRAAALLASLLLAAACSSPAGEVPPAEPDPAPAWIPLFDGESLDGWTPKIRGHALGEDPLGTFRVEDGLLRVSYERYDGFEGRFGHLFFEAPFSRYRLRVEYRFVGEQCPGGPGWAFRNSGVMLHGQAPETMALDQEFPVSIEAQMLGGDGEHERSTANLCTPGTHVEIDGELVTRHCTSSSSRTYAGDGWVTLELEVLGGQRIRHLMDGEVVLEYAAPRLDDGDPDARRLLAAGAPELLSGGWLSLQAESHPLDFRRVELLVLEE